MDIEEKLAQYRAKKQRQVKLNTVKEKFKNIFSYSKVKENTVNSEANVCTNEPLISSEDQISNDDLSILSDEGISYSYTDIFYYFLWFLLWIVLYTIFIELQFGTVFLITSAIVFIYLNTRTRPRRPNEISAYSVFNKNCESIDGTLKAEQFEREIRYGAGGIH